MSGRAWNEHQRRAIDARGGSVVVSAAAGSGKTSVLTERVLRLIEEGEDISRMLIVTFTNLAAGEMRERVYQRLQEAGRSAARLAAQAEKCAFADISTLHAFCGRLIRDNFEQAGISPMFAIADGAEAARLRQDALDQAIEASLQNEAQRRCVMKFSNKGDMQPVKNIISTIYNRAISLKEPKSWLDAARAHFDGGAFVGMLFEEYRNMVMDAAQAADQILTQRSELWRDSGFYTEADESESDRIRVRTDAGAIRMDDVRLPAAAPIFAAAACAPVKGSDKLTAGANKCFEALQAWAGCFPALVSAELQRTAEDGRCFIDLTRAFMVRYARGKRTRNVLDHDDTMHFALKVLNTPQIAARYREKYAHVFVDEYQDINEAQHAIISAIQRNDNDFLVGDVKQCIYTFRESNPELLVRRCRELSGNGLIEMNTNYRSTPQVIDFINGVMGHMMTEDAGGVAYTGGQRLTAGAPGEGRVNIVLAGREEEESLEAEITQLAVQINELVNEGYAFGDIAVLRPEMSGTGQRVAQALRDLNIPVVGGPGGDTTFGEFGVFINLLSVIDSPTDDVSLLSVLRFPYFGLTEPDFAHIRMSASSETGFCAAARAYSAQDDTGRKLERFWDEISRFRLMASCMKMPDFLMRLRQAAQFREYALTSPGGKTSDDAIGTFIAAVAAANPACIPDSLVLADRLQTARDAQPAPKQADGVYLTTIHKSKGLEFRVVILCGLHKKVDQRDARGGVLVGRALGLALDDMDDIAHIKRSTLHSVAVARGMKREKISETVRLLYVGMTRAVERLVLLGAGNEIKEAWREEKPEGWQHSVQSYFDLLMPAVNMACKDSGADIFDLVHIRQGGSASAQRPDKTESLNELLSKAEMAPSAELFAEYKFCGDTGVPSKVSVSALKRREQAETLQPQRRPAETDGISAAERGTLTHRVLQSIGLKRLDEGGVNDCVRQMAQESVIDAGLIENVDTSAISRYLNSSLAERSRASQRCLFEQPFCLRVSARELGLADSDEGVIVQGIIDMCFLENGEWVVVDYKTDRVAQTDAAAAAQKYALQLSLYARALESITKTAVREKYIYFLDIGEPVCI